jgi:TorA maturation chaperone TorD
MVDLPGIDRLQAAEARSGLYRLFAEIWLREPDAEVVTLLQRWAAGEPAPEPEGAGIESTAGTAGTVAQLRAEWTRIFVLNVPPYESLFVDDPPMLNTEATQRVADAYRRLGRRPAAGSRVGAPDHLGVELELLGQLAAEEARALGECDEGRASRLRAEQADFLHAHPLRWGPVACLAVERCAGDPPAGFPGFGALARLCREFLLAEGESLGGTGDEGRRTKDEGRRTENQGRTTQDARRETRDERSPDLAAAARHLAAPARSGVFLSRQDLARLARRLGLPGRLGDRADAIRDLCEAGLGYGRGDAVAAQVEGVLRCAAATYVGWSERYPAGAAIWRDWARRAERTIAVVRSALLVGDPAPDQEV